MFLLFAAVALRFDQHLNRHKEAPPASQWRLLVPSSLLLQVSIHKTNNKQQPHRLIQRMHVLQRRHQPRLKFAAEHPSSPQRRPPRWHCRLLTNDHQPPRSDPPLHSPSRLQTQPLSSLLLVRLHFSTSDLPVSQSFSLFFSPVSQSLICLCRIWNLVKLTLSFF